MVNNLLSRTVDDWTYFSISPIENVYTFHNLSDNQANGKEKHSLWGTIPDTTLNPQNLSNISSNSGSKPIDEKVYKCFMCQMETIPKQRRGGPWGTNTLCNPCGTKYAKKASLLKDKTNQDIPYIPLEFYVKPQKHYSFIGVGFKEVPEFLEEIKQYFTPTKCKEIEELANNFIEIGKKTQKYKKTLLKNTPINADHIRTYVELARSLCAIEDKSKKNSSNPSKNREKMKNTYKLVSEQKYVGITREGKQVDLERLSPDLEAIEAYIISREKRIIATNVTANRSRKTGTKRKKSAVDSVKKIPQRRDPTEEKTNTSKEKASEALTINSEGAAKPLRKKRKIDSVVVSAEKTLSRHDLKFILNSDK